MSKTLIDRSLRAVGVALLAATLFVAGCSDDDDSVKPPDQFAPPTNLTFQNREASIRVSWSASPDEQFSEFLGYNVYRDTESMANLSAAELAERVLNGSIIPKGTTNFVDTTAQIGVKYFYAVRAVRDNGNISISSNEVDTARFIQGAGFFTVFEFAATGESAFDVSEGARLSMRAENAANIDFYLGTSMENDGAGGDLVIKSPNLVSPDQVWQARIAGFKEVGSDASSTTTDGFSDSINLGQTEESVESTVFAVRLPPDGNGETHYARIEILTFNDDGAGMRSVEFSYRYQPIAGYPRF